jgi:hypothetical protein
MAASGVRMGDAVSLRSLTAEIPQGSLLSPLLFAKYEGRALAIKSKRPYRPLR